MNGYGISTEGSSLDNGGTISGDLDVTGNIDVVNLNVSDTLTASTIITEQELEIIDPLITCGVDNSSDAVNLGLIEEYKDGTQKWSGVVRSKDDKKQHFIDDVSIIKPTPSSNILAYDKATVVVGGLELTKNSGGGLSEISINNDIGLIAFNDDLSGTQFQLQHTKSSGEFKQIGGGKALIMTNTGDYTIDTNTLTVGNGATNYNLPTTRGTNNQVLQTDASGVVTWQDPTGGGGGSQTLQETYNLSTAPQISNTPSNPTLVLQQTAGSGADLLEIRNIGGNKKMLLGADGNLELAGANSRIDLQDSSAVSKWNINNAGGTDSLKVSSTGAGEVISISQTGVITLNNDLDSYELPTTRGTVDQILSTDASGVVSWVDQPPATLQANYDASTSPQILTDSTNNTLVLRKGLLASTVVLSIQDDAGVEQIALHGDGVMQVRNIGIGNPGTNYALPIARGEENDILRTDSSGFVTWEHGQNPREQSTGIISGGVLSINVDTTKFDISAGNGHVVNPATGTFIHVEWSLMAGLSTTYLGNVTYVSIDSSGTVVYSTTRPSNADLRERIMLGAIVHQNQVNIDTVNNEQSVLLSSTNQLRDLCNALGFINEAGNGISSVGGLTFQKALGRLFSYGSNYETDVANPHSKLMSAWDSAGTDRFTYRFQDGTSLLNQQNIIPNLLDDGTAPGDTYGNNRWGVQRVYIHVSNNISIQPAQDDYKSSAQAGERFLSEPFVEAPSITENGLLLGYLFVKGNCSDLSDESESIFLQASKYGSGTNGTGGLASLQSVYDNSIIPQIETDAVNSKLVVREGIAVVGSDILEIQNAAGAPIMVVNNTGLNLPNLIIQSGQLSADQVAIGEVAYKNGVGDERFVEKWDADALSLENAVGDELRRVGQTGTTQFKDSGTTVAVIDGNGLHMQGNNIQEIDTAKMDSSNQLGDVPTITALNLLRWDYSTIQAGVDITQVTASKADFGTQDLPRVITSEAYIIPNDIAIGGYIQWQCIPTDLPSARIAFGVLFKNLATVYSGQGVNTGEYEFIQLCIPNTNFVVFHGEAFAQNLAGSVTNGTQLSARVTRLDATTWEIGFYRAAVLLNVKGTFDETQAGKPLYFAAGVTTQSSSNATLELSAFSSSNYTPKSYEFSTTQAGENLLELQDSSANQIWAASSNDYVINTPLTTSRGVFVNKGIFGYACPVTSTFYNGVNHRNIEPTAGILVNTTMETDITKGYYEFGKRDLTRLKPGQNYEIDINGLISTHAVTPVNITFRVYLGAVQLAISKATLPLETGLVNADFRIWIKVTTESFNLGGNYARMRTAGRFEYHHNDGTRDTYFGHGITATDPLNPVEPPPTFNPGQLTVSAEWSVAHADNELRYDTIQYQFEGFNI